jgi:hypothetical protein
VILELSCFANHGHFGVSVAAGLRSIYQIEGIPVLHSMVDGGVGIIDVSVLANTWSTSLCVHRARAFFNGTQIAWQQKI